jgi:hypothetical protein
MTTPRSTPGRSGSASSWAAPAAAREENRVHPARPPTANATAAMTHPVADRPRTGVITTAAARPHSARNSAAEAHAPRWMDQATGTAPAATVPSCAPDSPKNQPILARE